MRHQRRSRGHCSNAHAPLFTRDLARRASLPDVVCSSMKSSVCARSAPAAITQPHWDDTDFIRCHLFWRHLPPPPGHTAGVGDRRRRHLSTGLGRKVTSRHAKFGRQSGWRVSGGGRMDVCGGISYSGGRV